SPDGKHLISTTQGNVMLWDLAHQWKGTCLLRTRVFQASYSTDGAVLALTPREELQLLVGEQLWPRKTTPDPIPARYLAVSPDDRFLAALDTGDICLSVLPIGWTLGTLRAPDAAPGVRACGLQFSVDGSLLVSASDNHRVYLWDTASGRMLAE